MAKPEPSMDEWLKEAKQDPKAAQCGMFLTHNGVVRITPKAQVREGVEGLGDVAQVDFSYDAEGLQQAVKEALTWPGVYYARVWAQRGSAERGRFAHVRDIGPTSAAALHRRCSWSARSRTSWWWRRRSTRRRCDSRVNENRATGSNEPAALFIGERNG